jgi:zinc protease
MLLLCFSLALPLAAQTSADAVKTFTLKNGMDFIILEDHSIPNADMYIFWKVGSRNEYPGITGLSHFFEHMMFNGAKKYGPKQFDRVMEANGGSNNAYTSENVTVYTDFFPKNALELIFDLEADRIANLSFDDKMIESERGVVLSERITSMENSNWDFLEEQVKAVAFMAHPYRWSVFGYESDIKNWKKSDLQRYFKTYYAPNNAVVVIVGDVTFEQIKRLAIKYFEPIPAQEPPRPLHTTEPQQLGEKRLVVHKDVTTPNIMVVYHAPEARSEDYYPMELLNAILSEGCSSRLYSQIVDAKQLATEVDTYLPFSIDPNLIYIYAIAAEGVAEDSLEKAILDEVEKVKQEISENELEKVKNRKLVEFYRKMETIDGKADNLGTYQVYFGDYKKLFTAPEDFQRVTVEDVMRVAQKYLAKDNRTVGILKKAGEE